MLASFFAEPEVATGALVRVMPKWMAFTSAVSLVQPSHKLVPRKVTAFREILVEVLRRSPLQPDARAG